MRRAGSGGVSPPPSPPPIPPPSPGAKDKIEVGAGVGEKVASKLAQPIAKAVEGEEGEDAVEAKGAKPGKDHFVSRSTARVLHRILNVEATLGLSFAQFFDLCQQVGYVCVYRLSVFEDKRRAKRHA